MNSSQPHVLAFPFPAQGHINPMSILCRKLSSMGILVTFVNTRSFHTEGDEFRYMTIPDDCLPKGRLGNNLQMFLNAMEGMRPDLEKLVEQLMSDDSLPRLTCLISDAFIGWTQDVATKFGICRASFWTTCASWALMCLHFPLLESHGLLPTRGSTRTIDFIPGLPRMSATHVPTTLQQEDEDDPGFKLRIERNELMRADAWVFTNSFYEMESSQIDQLKDEISGFIHVGPLQALPPDDSLGSTNTSSVWKEDVTCLDWLDEQEERSVVYISFGSLATLKKDEVEEIRAGLEKSGRPFLWVMRLDLLDENEAEVVSRIKENRKGMVISWAPQLKVNEHESYVKVGHASRVLVCVLQVLGHRSVGAFLSHCGWNSIMEAVIAGVPVLCRPCFGDQELNSCILVDVLKVGVRATESGSSGVSARRIEEAVKGVMSEEGAELRKRAEELRLAALQAVETGGSSLANLEAFVLDMKMRSTCKFKGT